MKSTFERNLIYRQNRKTEDFMRLFMVITVVLFFIALGSYGTSEEVAKITSVNQTMSKQDAQDIALAIEYASRVYQVNPALLYGIMATEGFNTPSPITVAKEIKALQNIYPNDAYRVIVVYGGRANDNPKDYYYRVVQAAARY